MCRGDKQSGGCGNLLDWEAGNWQPGIGMSTVIIAMHRSSAPFHPWLILAIIVLVAVILWLVLRLARPIGELLGEIGLNILNRIFGLILAAIAVEVIANGLKQLFPVLSPAT